MLCRVELLSEVYSVPWFVSVRGLGDTISRDVRHGEGEIII